MGIGKNTLNLMQQVRDFERWIFKAKVKVTFMKICHECIYKFSSSVFRNKNYFYQP